MNYYNEIDPKVAAWLRELIKDGLIPGGDVDERSIVDVQPEDLRGYTQCHFFAGIGGWSYALRLAGWTEDKPVWTGSCPCQPFSSAGKGLGTADERHLWPVFSNLIKACNPPVVFGEQVASKAARSWLSGVFADLEGMGYSRAGADLCAAGVGAHHVRQRIYWLGVSDTNGLRPQRERDHAAGPWSDQQFAGLVQEALQSSLPTGKSGGLSDGLPSRMVQLRGYGNAIVPQVAAEFIGAFMDCCHD